MGFHFGLLAVDVDLRRAACFALLREVVCRLRTAVGRLLGRLEAGVEGHLPGVDREPLRCEAAVGNCDASVSSKVAAQLQPA
jgi:hypothetical protein